MKAGVNKWLDIVVLDMWRAPELQGIPGSDWWAASLCFDEVSADQEEEELQLFQAGQDSARLLRTCVQG